MHLTKHILNIWLHVLHASFRFPFAVTLRFSSQKIPSKIKKNIDLIFLKSVRFYFAKLILEADFEENRESGVEV